ncbi:Cullin-domain-containing protein [Eremomyces bilateralis CBS 781.70]|uniref:Cullin-domain-containing protein n=1 Tax=Eremomyces bilateralis CBS 781.70 TaxID=1392243 RepID=A0A6G1FU87_9PEZI|nr:Cullin-domain-containing protein [Eremomyces bilateralis CBS 781.70]KAF1809455.1 Cullin-domain-containing protein [Eremomyces bilateralis CBS 781.70]
MDEGKKNVYDIYTLHLVRWKEDMFNHTHKEVMKAVLRLVEKQRNGETIEQSQIKQIVNSFVSLGLDESDSTKSTLDVYREYFEKPFLAATKAYYEQESKVFLAENSVVEYMKKAELRLDEEKDRVSLYLLNEITQPLMRTCEEALIADHSLLLRDEFQSLLDNDRQEDLGRMYKLLARIPDGLDPLRTRFETHVRKSGLAAIEKTTDKEIMEPKVYVETLLDVHTQYQSLVNMAFNGEAEFVRSLDNACREFVNRNKVCKSGTTKSPELLAKYCDTLLKRSGAKNSEEDDVEKQLTHIMTVFKYIEDKDVFQKFYTRGLARRLVHQLSASDDAETSMISKMKEACGFEYTNKLQRMFQDMQLSKDLNSNYKEWLNTYLDEPENKAVVDTYFQILGTSFWPLTAPNTKFSPPEIISKTYDRFQKFYLTKHQGRKLTWLWQLSKGEVRVNYIKPGKVPLTLQVSAYQTAILLLFNDADTLTYEDIEQGTLLFKEQLEPSVALMVKAKILNIQPEGAKPEKGTTFSLNYGFRTKKMKINLNLAVKSEAKQEVEDTHKTIEEDRKLLLQSAIVRIMKSRKRMKHQLLITETIEQIKNRFMPHVADIKKCIDILLEKEYLERIDSEDLGYLA